MLTLLRQPDVSKKFGAARPTIYEWMAEGLFPRPLKLGPKFAAWPEHECNAVLAARIQGKSKDEIKTLVSELTEARKNCHSGAWFRR